MQKESINTLNDESTPVIMNENHNETYEGDIKVICRIGTNKFEAFEFETNQDILVDESNEINTNYFRIEHHHANNSLLVMVADREEYCIYENATYFFDAEKIFAECVRQFTEFDISDVTEEFREYWIEEGEWKEGRDFIVLRTQ